MSLSPQETEVVQFLARAFPSFAALAPDEAARRLEPIGLVLANVWAGGAEALAARSIPVPPELSPVLEAEAARVSQARTGGLIFLARVRAALRDRFAPVVAAAAQLAKTSEAGSATSPRMTAARPQTREIGGFELVGTLGEGAMGRVFKARQKSLDRFVALKVLSPTLAQDADYVRRFHTEARAAAALKHPNIVGVIDQGTDQAHGVHYIAFELVDGKTLEEVQRQRGKLPEREALDITRQLALALQCAAQANIIHRDVKPANVIIEAGVPKLLDLGLARRRDGRADTSTVGVVIGTPAYMAPEQALGRADLDERVDIYSLGILLYELLTGRLPYEGSTSTEVLVTRIQQDVPDPRLAEPSISEPVAQLVLRCSARDRDARYAKAADVARDIDAIVGGRAPAPTPMPLTSQVRGPRAAGILPDEPPWVQELIPARVPDAGLAPTAPVDPAEALAFTIERAGDPRDAARGLEQLQVSVTQAGNRLQAAKAEAALAKAYLTRGDGTLAEIKARAALERDSRCRMAHEVLAKVARGDADRFRLEAALAAVRGAIERQRIDEARRLAEVAREAFPQEPHPLLAIACCARLAGNEADFIDGVRRAWGIFPSREKAECTVGGLDGIVVDMLAAQGRQAYRGDGSLLKATVEGLDDKSNLVAGSLRMAIGLARVALERGGLTLFAQRRLHFAMARALSGLRRYEDAADEIARAGQFSPSELEKASFEAERAYIGYMKNMEGPRAATAGRYRCLGAAALAEVARNRATRAGKEKQARTADIEKVGAQVAQLCMKNEFAKKAVLAAAAKTGERHPFEHVEAADAELAEIARERAAAAAQKTEKKGGGGFMSRLKDVAGAAASSVAGAAKEAQLMLRESQAKARLELATKRFALSFATHFANADYTGDELLHLAWKAASLQAALEIQNEEETRARKDAERLSAL